MVRHLINNTVLWTVVGFVIAYMERSPLDPKPTKYKDFPGCYISNLNVMVPLGQEFTSADCVLYRCQQDWFDYYTCNLTIAAPDCFTVSGLDFTKPYPDCCPKIQCFA